MTQATEVTEQDFDKAFAEAATTAETSVQAAPADTKTVSDTPAAEEKSAPASTEETAEAKAAREAAEKAAADAEAKAAEEARVAALTPEQRAEETAKAETEAKAAADAKAAQERIQAQAESEAKARQEAEAKAAADKKAAEDKARQEALDKELAPYQPSEEEAKALENFKKEWPEQAAALEARLKAADQDTKKKIHAAVAAALKEVAPRVAAVEEIALKQAQEAHLTAIRKAHTDFDTLVDKIPDWIKTQPTMLQPTLQKAYEEGDTQSVIDLFTLYKASAKPAASGGETAAAQAAREAKEAEEKKAREDAASLAPVKSTRTVVGPKGSKDPNDFDGAFAEAAAEVEGKK